jgi:hypothetical protein
MAWARIDDSFFNHPKIEPLSDRAFRAHIGALCLCNQYLTDGLLTERQAAKLATKRVREELIAADLWHPVDACNANSGIQVHDFHEYNRSRAEVEEERRRKSEAGKRGARARWGDGTSHGTSHDGPMADAMAPANGSSMHPSRPIPSHPDPGFDYSEKDSLQTEASYVPPPAEVRAFIGRLSDSVEGPGDVE